MLAIIYLILLLLLGDALCRRFFKFASGPHRFGAAFLTGALIGSWWTYLSSFLLAATNSPLLWGNLLFFVMCSGLIYWLWANPSSREFQTRIDSDQVGFNRWDWIATGLFLVYACWLTFATFSMVNGKIAIATHQWSDFGSTVSIMQSFANGHNFPTEYPHFSGDRIRYHFLFYFLAGNLEYLGLSPSTANNVLSILSMLSMLFIVMALGVVLFGSRLIGRIAACLFFFHGTLSFIPFLQKHWPVASAFDAVLKMRDFLPSGFGYRGELWGVWSQVVYANQRHLSSGIGILLLVMFFLIERYREAERLKREAGEAARRIAEDELARLEAERQDTEGDMTPATHTLAETVANDDLATSNAVTSPVEDAAERVPSDSEAAPEIVEEAPLPDAAAVVSEESEPAGLEVQPSVVEADEDEDIDFGALAKKLTTGLGRVGPFIFAGALLGLLPMWNGAVFTAAFAILAVFFVVFPYRRQLVILGLTTAVVALPQVIYLRGGDVAPSGSIFNWGYTLGEPSLLDVAYYLGWTFGVKWVLIIIAVATGTWLRNRVFIAIGSLIAVTFCLIFSPEALTNHKFLNVWLVIANIFTAAGIWWLWSFKGIKTTIPGKLLAIGLTAMIVIGGVIDLFPIRNSTWMYMDYRGDALVEWVLEQTDPNAVFLTNRVVNHGILLAGRRLFNGHTYYAWSAGYATGPRDTVYKRMYESRDPHEVFRLLKENDISYVAFDNAIRKNEFIRNHNEDLYKAYFEMVFEDPAKYDAIRIYAVPAELGSPRDPELANAIVTPSPEGTKSSGVNMHVGGKGTDNGQIDWPRGIAADRKGNIVIADTNNNRLQKFSDDGEFLAVIGGVGAEPGRFREPSGVAIDDKGNIYVADFLNHRVQKIGPDGIAATELKDNEGGDFAPRDVVVGSDQSLYVADDAKMRIVKFDRAGAIIASFGSKGTGDGQVEQLTSVAVDDKGDRVYVADPRQGRIVIFDRKGTFIANWAVAEWQGVPNAWYLHDIVIDSERRRVYASSTQTDEVLVFDMAGARLPSLRPVAPDKLEGAASMVVVKNKLLVMSAFPGRVSTIELGPTVSPEPTPK